MPNDPIYAPAPFNHAKADVILRSSDNIDFRIFKLFLSFSSTFFEALFELPQPTEGNKDQEVRDGLAVIQMTENSKTLSSLLHFCYPCTVADGLGIEEPKDALNVLEAAQKYSLDAIEKNVRQAISNPEILDAEPLQCFAVIHRGHLREETLLAAKYTLTQPLIPSWFEEIELITAGDFLSLLTYHKKCGDAVYALRLDMSWIASHYKSSEAYSCQWLFGRSQYWNEYSASTYSKNCGCTRALDTSKYKLFSIQPLQWWEEFMEETFTMLRDKPCKATVKASAEKTVQAVKERNCQACSPKVAEGMRDFVDLLARKIEETVSQIELELNF